MIDFHNYFEYSTHVAYMPQMLLLPECDGLYVLTFKHCFLLSLCSKYLHLVY